MRTTVTRDPDVESLLKQEMRERNCTFDQALNDALRRALERETTPRRAYRQLALDTGVPLVDLSKANALAYELEDLAPIQKLRARR